MDRERVDYDNYAGDYRNYRRPDPRIGAQIEHWLGDVESILNVGAGTGSYEPCDGRVIALERSPGMIARRPPETGPAVCGMAEALPFANASFDVATAILTLHHWQDQATGFAELRRVARRRVLLLTWVDDSPRYWLEDYFPEFRVLDRQIFPDVDTLSSHLGPLRVETIHIPADCSDGFLCAYWQRPEAYLDPHARAAISSFARIADATPGLQQLRDDLDSGAWLAHHGYLLEQDNVDLGYRLLIAELA